MERKVGRVARVVPQGPSSQVQNKQQVIGSEGYEKTSPFLFLSEDWFAPPGGFEEHPHRGMQTVTIRSEEHTSELQSRDLPSSPTRRSSDRRATRRRRRSSSSARTGSRRPAASRSTRIAACRR